MPSYQPTARSRAKRVHKRASYDHASVYAILDATPLCHVGYVIDGQPYVTPTVKWREGNRLFWHGSSASRMLRQVKEGIAVCLTVTCFDGLVLARSPFHHSANYRAVMAFGRAQALRGREEKERALEYFMDGLYPGRWKEVRPNTDKELKATTVVWMEIEEASAKVRTGPPVDDEEDYALDCWAGVLPLSVQYGAPVADERLKPGVAMPDYLR